MAGKLSYLASLFHQDDDAGVDSWLRNPSGATVYSGNSNINGYNYNIAASTFSNNVYNWQQSQLAQGLTLKSGADGDFAWEAIASRYDYLNDKQRVPTAALPGAFTGWRRHDQPHERHRLVYAGCQWRCGAAGPITKFPSAPIAMPKPLPSCATI